MNELQLLIDAIRAVEGEFEAARYAVTQLAEQIREDPSALGQVAFTPRDVAELDARLEQTFVIRLFAEFEAGLRQAWHACYGRPTRPDMRPLMDAVATRAQVPQTARDQVHELRDYRDLVVHEGPPEQLIGFREARKRIGRFLSFLPRHW